MSVGDSTFEVNGGGWRIAFDVLRRVESERACAVSVSTPSCEMRCETGFLISELSTFHADVDRMLRALRGGAVLQSFGRAVRIVLRVIDEGRGLICVSGCLREFLNGDPSRHDLLCSLRDTECDKATNMKLEFTLVTDQSYVNASMSGLERYLREDGSVCTGCQ